MRKDIPEGRHVVMYGAVECGCGKYSQRNRTLREGQRADSRRTRGLGMVVHTFDPSMQEAEADGSL